jgi:hypothetical protein
MHHHVKPLLPPACLDRDKRRGKNVKGEIRYQEKDEREVENEKKIVGRRRGAESDDTHYETLHVYEVRSEEIPHQKTGGTDEK